MLRHGEMLMRMSMTRLSGPRNHLGSALVILE
jgi:hypothetical protein